MSGRDEVLGQVPGWDMDRIRRARVLVAGAGALGNEVLKNLALMNVGQVIIVDLDRVELSNLSRSVLFRQEDAASGLPKAEVAAARLREINPEMSVLSLKGDIMTDLGLGLLRRMDVAIGCVDNRLARLYLNRWCFRAGIPWVNGGILNLSGQLSSYRHGDSCYECGLSKQGWQDIRARMGCADMVRRYADSGNAPTTPIAASVIGAMQVQEAIRLLHAPEGGLLGKLFNYEGQSLRADTYELLPPKAECDSHFTYSEVVEVPELRSEMLLGDFWRVVRDRLGAADPVLHLDHPLATELVTLQTGHRIDRVIPQPMLSDRVARALERMPGEGLGVPKGKLLGQLSPGSGLEDRRLIDLGIPSGHIVRLRDGSRRMHAELTGDLSLPEFGSEEGRIANPWFEFLPGAGK